MSCVTAGAPADGLCSGWVWYTGCVGSGWPGTGLEAAGSRVSGWLSSLWAWGWEEVPPAISTKPGAILLLAAAAPAATSRQRRLLETQLEDSGGWEAGVMSRLHRGGWEALQAAAAEAGGQGPAI